MLASAKPVLKTYTGLKRGRKKKSFLLTHKKRRMQGAARPYIPVGERDNYIDYQDDEGFIDGDDEYGTKNGWRGIYRFHCLFPQKLI